MKVYVASSWRNPHQPSVVTALAQQGHEVYDFRNPAPGNDGFRWTEIDPGWLTWNAETYRKALGHPVAVSGFLYDMDALKWADAVVLVNPCGRSAHLELGYAVGAGKVTVILHRDGEEPELMYKMVDCVAVSLVEVVEFLAAHEKAVA